MKNKFLLLLFLLSIIITTPLYSEEKVTVAVLDLTAKGVPKLIANAISDIIRSEFVNIGNFTVVERSQMNAILQEQGFQMTGCTDSACAVQVGKLLSARRIVLGEVNKIGGAIVITVRYVDVSSGKSIFSASDKSPDIDAIDSAAKRVAKDLATKIVSGDKEVITPKTARGFYLRSIIPGWGQFYAGNNARGFVYSGMFGLSCIASGYFVYDFYKKKSDYDDLPRGTADSKFIKARDDYKKAALYANISFGVIGTVYILHWIDIIFFSKSDFNKLIAKNEPSGIFIGNSILSTYNNQSNLIFGYRYNF